MHIIRPITLNDLDAFEKFAFQAAFGITSMPRNRDLLRKKIEHSIASLAADISKPTHETYLFVLEEIPSGTLGGVCGIYSRTGSEYPHYGFQIETLHKPKTPLPSPTEIKIMRPIIYQNGPTEIGTLFLERSYRKGGLGRLLSLSRFLFMASFPERFDDIVMARMRGCFDKDNNSLFFSAVMQHFLDIHEEDWKLIREHAAYIPSALPDYPIYVSLLPQAAQEVIGKVHPNTQPALKMLSQEGFVYNDQIDLFDGAPVLQTPRQYIRSVIESRVAPVASISKELPSAHQFILSNERIDFRACLGTLELDFQEHAIVSEEVATALQIKSGDFIRFVKPSATYPQEDSR